MIKIKLTTLLLFVLTINCLTADIDDVKKSSAIYMKFGVTNPPGMKKFGMMPLCGIGARLQRGHYGTDFSLNVNSLLFVNYPALKSMFLIFPNPDSTNQLYYGAGLGVGAFLSFAKIGYHLKNKGFLTLEGVLGYEFRSESNYKCFLQLELTQPVVGFGGNNRPYHYKPGVVLTSGFGF